MISNKNVANAVGGKTARACDSCIRKRARWYCAADDAFLCQACDSSVHSANPLACRHERVRLKTSSLKSLDIVSKETSLATSWHRGFTRKARTPRHGKPVSHSKLEDKLKNQIVPFVPELGSDEISHEDNEEEQLLYRVPIFDPFVAELCTSATVSNEAKTTGGNDTDQKLAYANGIQSKDSLAAGRRQDVDSLHGFLPSDTDLADFAADVESLLGRDLVNESFRMEELELVDCKEEQLQTQYNSSGRRKVKLEVEEINEEEEEEAIRECQVDAEIDMGKEPPFELSFDSDSATCGDEDENMKMKNNGEYEEEGEKNKKKNKKNRKILLRLDYEAVISAWASQGSPWTNGNRPEVDPDECWPDWMGNWGVEVQHVYGETGGGGGGGVGGQYGVMVGGGGREARVSRYREKRRTRLFSKKIRYEVRKLNAEKRPRMKGRFVKRATFASPTFSLHSK